MMLYPAMSELLKQVPSRYQLVNVVAARARKIAARAEREGLMLEEKPVSIAVQEIADGKLDEPVEEVMQEEGVLQGRFAHEQENAPSHEQPHHAAPVEATPAEPAFEEAAPVLESATPAEEPAPTAEDAEKPAE